MSKMKKTQLITLLLFTILGCTGQTEKERTTISDDFDKSPPIYYGMPEHIESIDTSSGWNQNGQKILLTGTVYENDGRTPASNILIYYYQTDINGKYQHKENEKNSLPPNKLGQTHGYIRGWVKTDRIGKYSIYTVRPGTYPSRDEPAHVHFHIKEPDLKDQYYIDDLVFDDDILLTTERRKKMENRGGSGVLRLVQKGDLQIGERNIVLGLNIPDYQKGESIESLSGKNIGEDIISFTPFHGWGPDKGTKTCPICKYGWYHGILFFVGNNPNWDEIKQWLSFLEEESIIREKYLKIYFVYGNENGFDKQTRIGELESLGKELNLEKVALTFVPSFSDKKSEIHLNNINPKVENTFILYKRSNVIDKFINLEPSPDNFKIISNRLDETVNEYFDLPRSKK